MNLIQLTLVNIKKTLKDPVKLAINVFMPICVVFFVYVLSGNDTDNSTSTSYNTSIAINSEDKGSHWQAIDFFKTNSITIMENERENALKLLESNKVITVYNIPEDFSEKINNYEKPVITAYKRDEGNLSSSVEINLNTSINDYILEKFLLDKNIISSKEDIQISETKVVLNKNNKVVDTDLNTLTMLLLYFIILGSCTTVTELLELKRNNVISRAISTPNKDTVIIGSLALSNLLFQSLSNILVLLIVSMVTKTPLFNPHIIIINILLASLFSISISLVAIRIFNNEGVASLITALFSVFTLLLSVFAMSDVYQSVPTFLINLGKFTPQYWMFSSLEKSILFPNIFIVLLIEAILFMGGSYKLKEFIRK